MRQYRLAWVGSVAASAGLNRAVPLFASKRPVCSPCVRASIVFLSKFVAWVVAGSLCVAGLVTLIGPAVQTLGDSVDAQAVALPPLIPLTQRTTILDANGKPLIQLYSEEDRLLIDFKDIPEKLIAIILATEDRDFFNHRGVNYKGIVRAFLNDVKGGKRQGGSTITQQLVKNALFENGRKNTAKDKAREAVWALRLESQMSKQQILSRYLNTIYFGNGAWGVRTAAERYFAKTSVRQMKDLTVPEMALLAGLIQSPDQKNPIDHPVAAKERRHEVFTALVAVGLITPAEEESFDKAPLPTKILRRAQSGPNSFFIQDLQQWLTADNTNNPSAAARALGADKTQREFRLYHGGLRITSTYDPVLQDALQIAEDKAKLPDPVDSSITMIENKTGAVRATYAGKRKWGDQPGQSKLNLATQGAAQPGSQIKVFTLAAALEAGYSVKDYINGGRCSFDKSYTGSSDPKPYSPGNEGHAGTFSLRDALVKSVNCAFMRLELSLGHPLSGPKKVIEMAERLGVNYPRTPFPGASTTLGTHEVSSLSMASAFSVLPDGGVRRRSLFATKIVDSLGTVIYDASLDSAPQVLNPEIARTLVDTMQGVIQRGTARGSGLADKRPGAGKTGTTDDSKAIWFTGFTPEYTTSVWVGTRSCGQPGLPLCDLGKYLGGNPSGGEFAAPIWKTAMDLALAGKPITDFTPPDQTLWPQQQRVTEDGRVIHAPRPYVPTPTTITVVGGTLPGTVPKTNKP